MRANKPDTICLPPKDSAYLQSALHERDCLPRPWRPKQRKGRATTAALEKGRDRPALLIVKPSAPDLLNRIRGFTHSRARRRPSCKIHRGFSFCRSEELVCAGEVGGRRTACG